MALTVDEVFMLAIDKAIYQGADVSGLIIGTRELAGQEAEMIIVEGVQNPKDWGKKGEDNFVYIPLSQADINNVVIGESLLPLFTNSYRKWEDQNMGI